MSAMASPRITSSPRLEAYQQKWSFEKAMIEVSQKQQQAFSDPPSPDMLNASSEDQIIISDHETPQDMKNLKGDNQAALHDQYMSSEEQLSPMDIESSASSAAGDVEDLTDDDEPHWL